MKLIDTHSHLYGDKFTYDLDAVIDRAQAVLSHVFLPNIDLESIPQMHTLSDKAPDFFFPMMGLHPCHAFTDYKEVLKQMEGEFSARKYWGVGETGLDYYWDKTFIPEQKAALGIQIEWAKDMSLPLILHCRDSMDDVIELVKKGQDGRLSGIFHCFNGSLEQAKQIMDLGFFMGIGGVITYKNGGLAEVVADIPLSSLVLETDSPYLPPVPHRGQRNESSYTVHVAQKLAETQGRTIGEVAAVTSANARKVFKVN